VFYKWNYPANTWTINSLAATYTGGLINVADQLLILKSTLVGTGGVGTFTFYMGVDQNPNGVLDFDTLYFDTTTVVVP
jgi:hypothetical protein